jgi:hypothetical protein
LTVKPSANKKVANKKVANKKVANKKVAKLDKYVYATLVLKYCSLLNLISSITTQLRQVS